MSNLCKVFVKLMSSFCVFCWFCLLFQGVFGTFLTVFWFFLLRGRLFAPSWVSDIACKRGLIAVYGLFCVWVVSWWSEAVKGRKMGQIVGALAVIRAADAPKMGWKRVDAWRIERLRMRPKIGRKWRKIEVLKVWIGCFWGWKNEMSDCKNKSGCKCGS